MALLEIACFSAENAIVAWNAGADRIELCDNQEAGGTTPSIETLRAVKQHVTIPVFVMIRPRGGNFNYSEREFDRMEADIDAFKSYADGYVFGILNQQHDVDVARMTQLVERAHPLPSHFHRAFDDARDQLQALEDVIACGCKAILSSGGAPNAMAGASLLCKLVQLAEERITIIAGGGVRAKNLYELHGSINANVYHSSALVNGIAEPDANEIREMKMFLRQQPSILLDTIEIAE